MKYEDRLGLAGFVFFAVGVFAGICQWWELSAMLLVFHAIFRVEEVTYYRKQLGLH